MNSEISNILRNEDENRLQVSQTNIHIENKKSPDNNRGEFSVGNKRIENITAGSIGDVQVEVNKNPIGAGEKKSLSNQIFVESDVSSRNRFRRLLSLFSKTNDLSPPTEGQCHVDKSALIDISNTLTQKYKLKIKLTTFTDSINNCRDAEKISSQLSFRKSTSNICTATNKDCLPINKECLPINKDDLPINKHDLPINKHDLPLNKHDLPIRNDWLPINNASSLINNDSSPINTIYLPMKPNAKNTKLLKWHEKLMNTLNAQKFNRLESSFSKLLPIEKGLVSRRIAAFNNKVVDNVQPSIQPARNHLSSVFYQAPDPVEISLRERVLLFNKNKCNQLTSNKIKQAKIKLEVIDKKADQPQLDHMPGTGIIDKIEQLQCGDSSIFVSTMKSEILKQDQENADEFSMRLNKGESTIQLHEEPMPSPTSITSLQPSHSKISIECIASIESYDASDERTEEEESGRHSFKENQNTEHKDVSEISISSSAEEISQRDPVAKEEYGDSPFISFDESERSIYYFDDFTDFDC